MRKASSKLLRTIAQAHWMIGYWRESLCRELAERPAAPRRAARGYGMLLDHFDAELAVVAQKVGDAERRYAEEKVRPHKLRLVRDFHAAELGDLHKPLPRFLGSRPELTGCHVVRPAPKAREGLARQVERTLDFLRGLDGDVPGPMGGIIFDSAELAGDLETGLRELEASVNALEGAEAEVAFLKDRADTAFGEAKKVASAVVGMMEGLGGLAGEDRLGGRMRRACA